MAEDNTDTATPPESSENGSKSPKRRRSSHRRPRSSRRSSRAIVLESSESSNKEEEHLVAPATPDEIAEAEGAPATTRRQRSRSGTPSSSKSPARTSKTRESGGSSSASPARRRRPSLPRTPSSSRRQSTSGSRTSSTTPRRSSSGLRRQKASRNISTTPPRTSSRSSSRRHLLEETHERRGASGGRSKRRVMSERHLSSSSGNNSERNLTSSASGSRRNLSRSGGGGKSRRKLEQRPHTTTGVSKRQLGARDSFVDQIPGPPIVGPPEEEDISAMTEIVQAHQEDDDNDEKVEENKTKGEKRKLKIFLLLLLLLLIGVGIFILLRRRTSLANNNKALEIGDTNGTGASGGSGGSSGDDPNVMVPNNKNTPPPTIDIISESPSAGPSLQIYDPPKLGDCDKARQGLVVDGQEDMDTKFFDLAFDITISNTLSIPKDAWIPAFQEGIDEVLIPALLGCPPLFGNPNRRLQEPSRGLQSIDSEIRYLIGNANATVLDNISDDCEIQGQQGCSRVNVQLQLYLKGEERGYAITSLIIQVISYLEELETQQQEQEQQQGLENGKDNGKRRKLLEEILGLNLRVFLECIFRRVSRRDPTAAPSVSPSGLPSVLPSGLPSLEPSSVPSVSPTKLPTPLPTPGPTPRPTPGPTRPPTPGPTPPPTRNPTPRPTPPPTPGPTRPPTPGPSPQPTTPNPTPAPTPPPTVCQDDLTFFDFAAGDPCSWYNANEPPGCPTFGQETGTCQSSPTGVCTATEACCICQQPLLPPTENPTSGPTVTMGPTAVCSDDLTFSDFAGDGCDWYNLNEPPGCPNFGQEQGSCQSSPTGVCTATEACCICQETAPPPTPFPTSGPTLNPTSGPTAGLIIPVCINEPFLDEYLNDCTWWEGNDDYGCSNFGGTVGICGSSPTGFCSASEACCHCNQDTPPLETCADNPTFRDDYFLSDCDLFVQEDPDCLTNSTDSGTCALLAQGFTCTAMDACCHCSQDPSCIDNDPTFFDDNGDCQWYEDNDSPGCPTHGNLYDSTCFPTVPCTPSDACCHCQ